MSTLALERMDNSCLCQVQLWKILETTLALHRTQEAQTQSLILLQFKVSAAVFK